MSAGVSATQMEFHDSDFSFLKTGTSAGSSIWNFHHGFKSNSSLTKMSALAPQESSMIPLHYIEEVDDAPEDNFLDRNDDEYVEEPKPAPSSTNAKTTRAKRPRDDDDLFEAEEEEEEEAPAEPEEEEKVPRNARGRQIVDITEYLCLPQSDAAVKLGLPVSTLSKRWKEAAKNRKWPFRKVSKIDKEIAQLLQGVPQDGEEAGALTPELEHQIGVLLRQRQDELRRVSIRL